MVRLLDETLALNKRNYRQYTWQHRRAVRMWQVLSLLTPHLHPVRADSPVVPCQHLLRSYRPWRRRSISVYGAS